MPSMTGRRRRLAVSTPIVTLVVILGFLVALLVINTVTDHGANTNPYGLRPPAGTQLRVDA